MCEGGRICGTLRYYLPIFDISMQCSNTVVRTDGTRIDNSCALIGPPYVCLLLTKPNMTPSHEMKSPKAFPECTNKCHKETLLNISPFHNCVMYLYCGVDNTCMITEIPLHVHFTDCSPMDLWNMNATGATFQSNVRLLNEATRYQSCGDGSVGSAVLENSTLNTATVAYYTGSTPGSIACFVCDENSGYALNATSNMRVCQSDGTWSKSPTTCSELHMSAM